MRREKKALEAEKAPPLHFSHAHVPYNADVENELIDHLLSPLTHGPHC